MEEIFLGVKSKLSLLDWRERCCCLEDVLLGSFVFVVVRLGKDACKHLSS